MADLFFCPERWEAESAVSTNVASHIRVKGCLGKQTDAWQIGSWEGDWTAITSSIPFEAGWLEPGAEYRFCFWLNGGENADGTEVCNLEIFGDDWEDRMVFRLNRDATRPILEKNGWLLFAVPFTAPPASSVLHLRFTACGAVCTIAGIPEMNMAVCEALPPDERVPGKPMRYNIVFPDGYPESPEKEVVLKAYGREVHFSRKLFCAAAILGVTAGIFAIFSAARKKK